MKTGYEGSNVKLLMVLQCTLILVNFTTMCILVECALADVKTVEAAIRMFVLISILAVALCIQMPLMSLAFLTAHACRMMEPAAIVD